MHEIRGNDVALTRFMTVWLYMCAFYVSGYYRGVKFAMQRGLQRCILFIPSEISMVIEKNERGEYKV